MDCEDIKKNLFRIVEDSLPPSERSAMDDHLHSCHDCALIISEFRKTTELIEKEISTEPNPFIGTRILQHLESSFSGEHKRSQRSFYRVLQPAIVSLGIMLAVLIGFTIGKKGVNSIPVNSAEQEIESVRADLFITDMADEEKILILNH